MYPLQRYKHNIRDSFDGYNDSINGRNTRTLHVLPKTKTRKTFGFEFHQFLFR